MNIFQKIFGKSKKEPEVSDSVFLYCQSSRPFHWISDNDTGNRPCVKVNGITLSDAVKKFNGRQLHWSETPYHIVEKLTDGEKFFETSNTEIDGLLRP